MKANDFIQFAEYMKAFGTEKPKRLRKKMNHRDFEDVDLLDLFHHKLREAKAISDFLKDQEKINKKEDKKDDGKSIAHIALLLVFSFPITAPLYVAFVRSLLH